jgi:hypothetical protein
VLWESLDEYFLWCELTEVARFNQKVYNKLGLIFIRSKYTCALYSFFYNCRLIGPVCGRDLIRNIIIIKYEIRFID